MSCNVLIVDDSMSMRAVIRKIIMLSKFDVDSFFEAANGREALKVLASSWVDVVITDINMPVMNGINDPEMRKDELTAKSRSSWSRRKPTGSASRKPPAWGPKVF